MKFKYKNIISSVLVMSLFFSNTGIILGSNRSHAKESETNYNIVETGSQLTKESNYDVIVFGSDPEGVAAAASASKNGLCTLLIDFGRNDVGGLYTQGWLNMIDFNNAPDNDKSFFDTRFYPQNYLNHGIFDKFYKLIGKNRAFDVPRAQKAFETILSDENVEVVFLNDKDFDYEYDKSTKTSSIVIRDGNQSKTLKSKIVIDCMPNADLAIKAGAKFNEGKEDLGLKNRYQASTLVFKIKGVDWKAVQEHLAYDGDSKTGANGTSAWGYDEMFKCPVDNPKMQMRGLNLGLQEDQTVLVNAFQIFDLDPYDTKKDEEIRQEAKKRIEEDVVPYMKQNLVGFENVEFVDVAPEFYIRETRHLVGEDKLTAEDVFTNNFPKNFIASGSYPIDIQAKQKGDMGTVLSGTKPYGITVGMMIPEGIDGIFVASKCASFDSVAFGSARTVPVLMAMGEAAGAISKLLISNDLETRQIINNDSLLLQARNLLFNQGVRLIEYPNSNPTSDSYAEPEIKFLRSKALLSMGYDNDYKLDEPASVSVLESIIYLVENNSNYKITAEDIEFIRSNGSEIVTIEDMMMLAQKILGVEVSSIEALSNKAIIKNRVYDALKAKSYKDNKGRTKIDITNEDMYAIMGGIIEKTPMIKP